MENGVLPEGSESPEDLVRLFKYYRQFSNKLLKCRQKFKNVMASGDYSRNRKSIDRLNRVLIKYRIDREGYVRFCATSGGCQSVSEISDFRRIKLYSDYLKRRAQYGSIVYNFRRSAMNLADMCISNGTTPATELARIVMESRLAYEYASGRLSKYFIASIANFKKIYEKLDQLNRDELRILYDVSDELHEDVKRAFLEYEKRVVAPLGLTDEMIKQKQTEKQEKSRESTKEEKQDE